MTEGGGRVRRALETPVVPHLPPKAPRLRSPSPVHDSLLRFDQHTPNPSAPSSGTQGVGGADVVFGMNSDHQQSCISCNKVFTPRGGENCYGKCDDCLDGAFYSFVHVHALQVAQAVGPQGVGGDPSGVPSHQPSGTTESAVGPISGPSSINSLFLSLAPEVFCRRCGRAFRPLSGSECNSLCLPCSSLSFLRSPSPKRRRFSGGHRKAGPPD